MCSRSQFQNSNHNNWAWQTGSIFIILSLAALWASTQIDDTPVVRFQYTAIFCFFSVSIVMTWYFFILRRARHIINVCWERIYEIEEELKEKLKLKEGRLPLHQRIRKKDECYKTRAIYGVYLFLYFTIIAWACVLILDLFMIYRP